MTDMLTSADLVHRLHTGGGCYEPPTVEIGWRSAFDDRPILEFGFHPDTDEGDDEALEGSAIHHEWKAFPYLPPWRDQYLIFPAGVQP